MLKAGSIVYALAIALLISAISGALILLGSHFKLEQQRYEVSDKLIDNANAGILILQHNAESQVKTTVDIYDNGSDSVVLFKRPWGFFDVALVSALHQGKVYRKAALLGCNNTPSLTTSLYLADHGKPLKLCGETRVAGDCFLPKSGVERAYIEGQNYIGNQLIYGKRHASNRQLPEPNKGRINAALEYLHGNFSMTDSVVAFDALLTDSIIHSFSEKTLVILSQSSLDLTQGYFAGNIIFHAKNRITIAAGVQLDNVQLYASEITFLKRASVCVQAFASKQLVVENEAQLQYPSVLGTLEKSRLNTEASLLIGDDVTIAGAVFVKPEKLSPRFPAQLSIGFRSVLHGTAYVNGLTELKGAIHGSLYTEGLTLKTPSSIYQRTLLNATIERDLLSKQFVEPALFAASPKNGIAVWLN